MYKKAVILAGGSGSRLLPMTLVVNKHLLPVYDKPLIYYPLSLVMLAGVREVALVVNRPDLPSFEKLLGNGSRFGISIHYIVQDKPLGVAHGISVAKKFINNEPFIYSLGDNLFVAQELTSLIKESNDPYVSTVFCYQVPNPSDYGVLEFRSGTEVVVGIEEKPKAPKSNWAVTGLYLYGYDVCDYVDQLTPSSRGELEISDLNSLLLTAEKLQVKKIGRGSYWTDVGNPGRLSNASNFIRSLQDNMGVAIGDIFEISDQMGLNS